MLTRHDGTITDFKSALTYPDLLDAELEDLVEGLNKGTWTSVDLTKVVAIPSFYQKTC